HFCRGKIMIVTFIGDKGQKLLLSTDQGTERVNAANGPIPDSIQKIFHFTGKAFKKGMADCYINNIYLDITGIKATITIFQISGINQVSFNTVFDQVITDYFGIQTGEIFFE